MKTKVIKVETEFPDLDKITECASIIQQGGLVVFPTETVYGVACDYNNQLALERLKAIKKRSTDKPFSILISQIGLISNYTSSIDPSIYKIISRFWPGPLTVVIPAKEEGKTIGVRMPDHPIALKLAEHSQCSLAAPSANVEGNPAPVTCEEALRDMDGFVEIAIDGGTSKIGTGSSVVDMTGSAPVILRTGHISESQVQEVVNRKTILFVCTGNSCRSVMAEYLLKEKLKNREDIEVASAGTGVFLQSMASQDTLTVLFDKGIDASVHLSQSINTILLKQSELIFVMTRSHRQQVLERVPSVEQRVYLLKEFANTSSSAPMEMDIPDPMGKNFEAYKESIVVIEKAIDKILELI